jgi:hypothetical protein
MHPEEAREMAALRRAADGGAAGASPARGGVRARLPELLWLLALLGGLLLFWTIRILRAGHEPLPFEAADLSLYFLPSYAFEAERFRDGSLPFWNPWQAAGQPFLASMQPGVLYPARLLLLVLDVPTAMHVASLGHVLLVFVAVYALCRTLGAAPVGAGLGAAAFTGTFAIPNMYWPSYLEAGAWLPIGGLALARLARTPAWRWVALLGVSLAMPVLAGGYQMTLYVAYGIGLLGVALLVDPRRRGSLCSWRAAGALALAGVIAAGTAAPQLLPTLAWTAETVRRAGALTDVQIMPIADPGHALRETIWPGPGFSPFHLSLPVVVLALIGFVRQRRFGAALGVIAIALYLVSLGRGTPFFAVYRVLPGLAMFRLPRRLFTLVAFFCAVAAALAITPSSPAGARSRRMRAAAAVAFVLVLAGVFGTLRNRAELPWTAASRRLTAEPALVAALRRVAGGQRVMLPDVLDANAGPRVGTLRHLRVLQDYEPLSTRRLDAYLRAVAGLPPARADAVVPFVGSAPPQRGIARAALVDLAGVRAVLLPRSAPVPARTPPFAARLTTGKLVLYENPLALPRAFTVTRARVVPDERAALATLLHPDFDGRREAVLVGPRGAAADALTAATAAPLQPAVLVTDRPEEVEVAVDVAAPAVLVLADAYAPGWRATVDGAPRPIWLANHLMRGVPVQPGERRVRFTYEAPGFATGTWLAALAWSVFGLVATVARRRPLARR